MSFLPLDRNILTSTLWADGTPEQKVLWIYLLLAADVRTGIVIETIPGIALRSALPVAAVRIGLAWLAAPDPDSRTTENDGCRIEIVEQGIKILNYEKYKYKDYSTARVAKFRSSRPLQSLDKSLPGSAESLQTVTTAEKSLQTVTGTTDTDTDTDTDNLKEKEQSDKPTSSESEDIREVFDFWRKEFGPKAKLTKDRIGKIKARLKEGFTAEELKQAVSGCKKSDYHVSGRYTGINTILKSAETVEGHIARLMGNGDLVPSRSRSGQLCVPEPEILKMASDEEYAAHIHEQFLKITEKEKLQNG